jgi:asparagine synthase (glutamine-hydrolysing)
MFRYFIVNWNATDAAQCSAARLLELQLLDSDKPWQKVLSTANLSIFAADSNSPSDDFHILPNDSGAILGRLFRTYGAGSYSAVPSAISDAEGRIIVESEGRHLITHYWGRYVGLIRQQSSGKVQIVRDPSGALPCLFATYDGTTIIFSDALDYSRLPRSGFSTNWNVIQAIVVGAARPQTGETAVREISELRAGESLQLHANRSKRKLYWNPIDESRAVSLADFDDLATQLRHTVRACVHSWAMSYPRIIHNLSGGMDSSILLSALADAPNRPDITAINYFTKAPEGDERIFSRSSARMHGVTLVEYQLDGSKVDLRYLLDIDRSPFPNLGCTTELLFCEFEKSIAAESGAAGFFQGVGGDGVFLQNGAENATADYLRIHGIRLPLMKVAHDAARITSKSIWALIRFGFAVNRRRSGLELATQLDAATSFANPDVFEWVQNAKNALADPLFSNATEVPQGKLWHIYISNFPADYYRPFRQFERPEAVFPLASQPIRELCLRIPVYHMFRNGTDRAVARRAFAQDVPADVMRRRSKGVTNQVLREMFDTNLGFIREFLLDGLLMKNRVIDREKLERFLSGTHPPGVQSIYFCNEIISTLLPTEALLRSWETPRRSAVVA